MVTSPSACANAPRGGIELAIRGSGPTVVAPAIRAEQPGKTAMMTEALRPAAISLTRDGNTLSRRAS